MRCLLRVDRPSNGSWGPLLGQEGPLEGRYEPLIGQKVPLVANRSLLWVHSPGFLVGRVDIWLRHILWLTVLWYLAWRVNIRKWCGRFEHFLDVWGFPKPFLSIPWIKNIRKVYDYVTYMIIKWILKNLAWRVNMKKGVVNLSIFQKSGDFRNLSIRFLGSNNIRKEYDYVTYDHKMDFEKFSLMRQHEKRAWSIWALSGKV